MKFQVWIACSHDCIDFEPPRTAFDQITDAVEAIKKANQVRDNEHQSWIEIIEYSHILHRL